MAAGAIPPLMDAHGAPDLAGGAAGLGGWGAPAAKAPPAGAPPVLPVGIVAGPRLNAAAAKAKTAAMRAGERAKAAGVKAAAAKGAAKAKAVGAAKAAAGLAAVAQAKYAGAAAQVAKAVAKAAKAAGAGVGGAEGGAAGRGGGVPLGGFPPLPPMWPPLAGGAPAPPWMGMGALRPPPPAPLAGGVGLGAALAGALGGAGGRDALAGLPPGVGAAAVGGFGGGGGVAGPPPAGALPLGNPWGVGPTGGGPEQDSAWVVAAQQPWAMDGLPLRNGAVVEVATIDPVTRQIDGTALGKLRGDTWGGDHLGRFGWLGFGGASSVARGIELEQLWGCEETPAAMPCAVHFCRGPRETCSGALAGVLVYHVDTCRLRTRAKISEVWARATFREPAPPTEIDILMPKLSEESERTAYLQERLARARKNEGRRRKKDESHDERLLSAARHRGEQHRASSRHDRSKRKKRKRSSSSSSRSSRSDSRSDSRSSRRKSSRSLFRDASAREQPIQAQARRDPGGLYSNAYEEMGKRMGTRTGADTMKRVKAEVFLNTIFFAQYPEEKLGPRNVAELRTVARTMDKLAEGELGQLGDTLMQRFKALMQVAADGGNWSLAKHLELVPAQKGALASEEECASALREEIRLSKMNDRRGSEKKRGK